MKVAPPSKALFLALSLTGACAQEPEAPQPDPAPVAQSPAPERGAEIPFDAARAWADLERVVGLGPRHPGSPALATLVDDLEAQLTALGFRCRRETFTAEVPRTEATPSGTQVFTNLVADLEGEDPSAPWILVGGHIDTKFLGPNFVGANDGGSSTVCLLELARGLAASGERPLPWRLVFFDGEEAIRTDWLGQDNTYGSRRHVIELAKRGEDRKVGAVVVVDMIADRDLVLTWDDYSTAWLRQVFWKAARDLGLEKHTGTRALGTVVKDDHLPFLDADLPAVDLIDLDFGGRLRPWWHNDEDQLDKCSQASLDAFGRILTRGLVDLELLLRERR